MYRFSSVYLWHEPDKMQCNLRFCSMALFHGLKLTRINAAVSYGGRSVNNLAHNPPTIDSDRPTRLSSHTIHPGSPYYKAWLSGVSLHISDSTPLAHLDEMRINPFSSELFARNL